jgi:hypothetical protein
VTAESEEYEQVWWRTDAGVLAAAAADPSLGATLELVAAGSDFVTTAHVYSVGGVWRSNRQALHEPLVVARLKGSPTPEPVVYFTLGCPGAGKSSALRRVALDHLHDTTGRSAATIIDADGIRRALPEYAGGVGSGVVAAEAYSVTYDVVLPLARSQRRDMVFDTMGRAAVLDQVRSLLAHGYAVRVLLAEAPETTCTRRAARRALADGRQVPTDLVALMRPEARRTFEAMCRIVDCAAVLDTAAENRRPEIVEVNGPWADDLRKVVDALPDAAPIAPDPL